MGSIGLLGIFGKKGKIESNGLLGSFEKKGKVGKVGSIGSIGSSSYQGLGSLDRKRKARRILGLLVQCGRLPWSAPAPQRCWLLTPATRLPSLQGLHLKGLSASSASSKATFTTACIAWHMRSRQPQCRHFCSIPFLYGQCKAQRLNRKTDPTP